MADIPSAKLVIPINGIAGRIGRICSLLKGWPKGDYPKDTSSTAAEIARLVELRPCMDDTHPVRKFSRQLYEVAFAV